MTIRDSIHTTTRGSIAVLVIACMLLSTLLWTWYDESVKGTDTSNHLIFSLEFFDELSFIVNSDSSSFGQKVVAIVRLFAHSTGFRSNIYWPNGLNATASIFYYLGERSLLSAKISILPYLFLVLFFTFLIGRLVSSQSVGLLAVFILFMYPLIFQSARQFQLDLPLTAMVVASIYFMIKSENFKNTRYSVLLGLSWGWGMVIKGQIVLFLMWPLLVLFWRCRHVCDLKAIKRFLQSRELRNAALCLFIVVLIGSLWWANKIGATWMEFNNHVFSEYKAREQGLSLATKYSFTTMTEQCRLLFYSVSPPLCIAFVFSLVAFVWHRVPQKSIILSWLIGSFLFFSVFIITKHVRFLMPILPAMALITGWGLLHIRVFLLRSVVIGSIVIFCVIQFFMLSYQPPYLRDIRVGPISLFGRTRYETAPPQRLDFGVATVVDTIRHHAHEKEPVNMALIDFTPLDSFYLPFLLKSEEASLNRIDIVEDRRQFLRCFKDITFILYCTPMTDTMIWPGEPQFDALVNQYFPSKMRSFNAETWRLWRQVSAVLLQARPHATLLDAVPAEICGESVVYYLYRIDHPTEGDAVIT